MPEENKQDEILIPTNSDSLVDRIEEMTPYKRFVFFALLGLLVGIFLGIILGYLIMGKQMVEYRDELEKCLYFKMFSQINFNPGTNDSIWNFSYSPEEYAKNSSLIELGH